MLRPNYRGRPATATRPTETSSAAQRLPRRNCRLDRVIAMGIADPDKLRGDGMERGGHLTNKLITFTNRFKAASSGAAPRTGCRCTARPTRDRIAISGSAAPATQRGSTPTGTTRRSRTCGKRAPRRCFSRANGTARAAAQAIEMMRALRSHGVTTHLEVAPSVTIWTRPAPALENEPRARVVRTIRARSSLTRSEFPAANDQKVVPAP